MALKKKLTILLGIAAVLVIGGLYMINIFTGEEIDSDKQVAQKIAKRFSEKYLAPNGKEVSEITFYDKPSTPQDATGSRFYVFYINDNKGWRVTASVSDGTDKILGYGSDYIDLEVKDTPKAVNHLKINYWEN